MAQYRVTELLLERLKEQLEKANKRAARTNLPPLTLRELGRETVKVGEERGVPQYGQWVTVELEGEAPKFAGWEFRAALDHRESGVVVRSAPGFETNLPERFRTADKACDHCKKQRHRRDVFVLFNAERDEYTQVGRQCLKDFLGGVDPTALAKYFDNFAAFTEELEGGEGGNGDFLGGSFRGERQTTARLVFEKTALALRVYGWQKRGGRDEQHWPGKATPTADRVTAALLSKDEAATDRFKRPVYYGERVLAVAFGPEYDGGPVRATDSGLGNLPTNDEDRALADGVVNYVQNEMSPRGDFEHNLKVLVSPDLSFVRAKDVGMLAAAVMVYQRHLGNEVKYAQERAKRAALGNGHVGEVGRRLVLDVTVVETKTFASESSYGGRFSEEPRTLVTMVDAENNLLKWWTGGLGQGTPFAPEAKLTVKATVKKHGDYNGKPETTVTRVQTYERPALKAPRAKKRVERPSWEMVGT